MKKHTRPHRSRPPGHPARSGVWAALAAALLFGAGTPFAKLLLAGVDPWLMAGLLYLGSGLGLGIYRALRRAPRAGLAPGEWPWLAGRCWRAAWWVRWR
ncbi:EamA family transporter [Methylomagnum ishizawai]|uniref:EamA family transporter n=1 Tax=Methylomagnum ishizawai TaxID=1760988 RepID=UPI0020CAC97F|nr:EamA family transporter [Methylomagnum ishizawai]